jgi:beta-galactosidase
VSGLEAWFVQDATRQLPATVAVSYWTGQRWMPVSLPPVTLASPTTISFEAETTPAIRLDMTSVKAG